MLARPALVELIVVQVAPECRQLGRLRVRGRAGVNRVPFSGRIRGRPLAPGAYRIRARVLPRGRALAETTLVIFRRKPDRAELAAARRSNTCRSDASGNAEAGVTGAARPPGTGEPAKGRDEIKVQGAERSRGRGLPAGVLGVQFSRAAEAVKSIHPLLYVLLGIAIALLGLAAVPVRYVPNARIAAVLAYRRSAVAIAGAAALITVSVFYVLA